MAAKPIYCNDMLVIASGRTHKVLLAFVAWHNAFANGALYSAFLNWVKSHIILCSCYASYHPTKPRESYLCTILHPCLPGHCHLHFLYNLFSKFILSFRTVLAVCLCPKNNSGDSLKIYSLFANLQQCNVCNACRRHQRLAASSWFSVL